MNFSQPAKGGLIGVIVHQPETKIPEALYLFLETCNVVVMDYNMHSLGFLYPCLVLEIKASRGEGFLGQQVEINLQMEGI